MLKGSSVHAPPPAGGPLPGRVRGARGAVRRQQAVRRARARARAAAARLLTHREGDTALWGD